VHELRRYGVSASQWQVRKARNHLGIRAIYPGPKTSAANKEHKKYPYLLAGLDIERPNQVWATDITYIRAEAGFMHLVAIVDLYSRRVLSHRLSNSMNARFCVDALKEAINEYGWPEIFNTDQGSQFTGEQWINMLKAHGVRICMDGKGRALDNVCVERLWRSLKYEDIYLNDYESVLELRRGVVRRFLFYNIRRFHQSLGYQTTDEVYFKSLKRAA
jgi:putative transposase